MESCFNLPTKRCILCAYNSLPCYLLTFNVSIFTLQLFFFACKHIHTGMYICVYICVYACFINFLNLPRNSFLNCLTINIISISTNTNRHKNEATIFLQTQTISPHAFCLSASPKDVHTSLFKHILQPRRVISINGLSVI